MNLSGVPKMRQKQRDAAPSPPTGLPAQNSGIVNINTIRQKKLFSAAC
jgi:hypothetical protein